MILPRVIRLRDAPGYLGMDKNRFYREVRPYLTEIRYGNRSVGFDRLDLDAWVDEYKERNGRPAKKGGSEWDVGHKDRPVYENGAESGIFTKESGARQFAEALERVTSRRPNGT